jgi:hypothetical protein
MYMLAISCKSFTQASQTVAFKNGEKRDGKLKLLKLKKVCYETAAAVRSNLTAEFAKYKVGEPPRRCHTARRRQQQPLARETPSLSADRTRRRIHIRLKRIVARAFKLLKPTKKHNHTE